MLTNLDWLAEGKPWPPPSEKARIDRYKEHERLFLTEHNEVWKKKFQALADRYKKKNWDVKTILNYHQLLSKKTADFVCGQFPAIETEGDTDRLSELMNEQNFGGMLYEGIIDVSRYGNGLVKFVGKGLTEVNPQYWIPIVDPTNMKSTRFDVIGYPTNTDADGKPREIYAEVHSPGMIEIRRHGFNADSSTIGALLETAQKTSTGLDISAVQRLTNLTHSGSLYGLDDYNIVNSLIAQIMWRLYCADTIMDKHSDPNMTGPSSALQYDDKLGMYYVPLDNYFKRDNKEDPDVGYVTWDGGLEANFKELELLLDQLYILTEMGQAFADAGGDASDASGTALKLRMVSPRVKAQRLVSLNHATVKKIIFNLAKLNGIKIEYKTLTVHWSDGLPVDEKEQIDTLVNATGGKAVMSQYTALKKRGLSDKEVDEELDQIRDEDAAMAPLVAVPRTDDNLEAGDDE
jgi:hypothetical protein